MFNFQKREQTNLITQINPRINPNVQPTQAQTNPRINPNVQTNPRIQRQMYAQLIYQNQNRLPVERTIQKRIIMPTNNIIDLHNNINSNVTCKKTIGHVLYFNLNFKLDLSGHSISKYLTNETEVLFTNSKIHLITYYNTDNAKDAAKPHINLYSIIEQFINSNEENLYISINLYYNKDIVSQDIKDCINYFLKFKQQYYDIVDKLFNLKKYNVLHIRCLDTHFNTDFGNDAYLFTEIIKLQLSPNTIIISNNYGLKIKINKLFGFHFIDKNTYHAGKINDYTELDSTIHTDHTNDHLKGSFNTLKKYENKIKVNIIIYIHICQKEGWKKSFSILINSIKNSQLYNEVEEIRLGIVNDNGILIEDELLKDKKYKIIYIGKSYEYERPTLLHMKKYSEIDSFNTLYCYLHTKGISHFNTKNENAVLNWIYDMLKHNIYKWKNVIEKLKKYETYGCNYNKIHYSGNFWWSTIKHIKKLPNYIKDYYTAPEDWILINKDNMYCENNCNDNFKSPFPDNFYKKMNVYLAVFLIILGVILLNIALFCGFRYIINCIDQRPEVNVL